MRGRAGAMALALLAGLLPGCAGRPLLPYSLDTPPLLLAPAATVGVTDGRGRFRQIFCDIRRRDGAVPASPGESACEDELHRLAGEPPPDQRAVPRGAARTPLRVMLVPGLYGDCIGDAPQIPALSRLESMGYGTGVIAVSGSAASADNARRIRDAVEALVLQEGERLILVGYSKGVTDILEALVAYPEIVSQVSAVLSVAGVISGTPLADRTEATELLHALAWLSMQTCPDGPGEALHSLKRSTRLAWLASHSLPSGVPTYSLAGFATREEIPGAFRPAYRLLAQIDPRNDGVMLFFDTVIPGSTLLGFAHTDHWGISPLAGDETPRSGMGVSRSSFPRGALLEAAIRQIEEDLTHEP